MISRTATVITACAALLASAQAQAAQKAECLTRVELRGVIAFALPTFAEGMVERCSSRLPSDAYLTTRGPALVKGLREGQAAAWPMARTGIVKLAGGGDTDMSMLEDMPMEMVEPLFASMIQTRFIDGIKTSDCEDANNILRTLDPLKPENFVDFITEVMVIGSREDKDIRVCPAG